MATVPDNISYPFAYGGPLEVIQHQAFFKLALSGRANPSWRFVEVTVNGGRSLLGVSRSRSDDLLITMGPVATSIPNRKLGPSTAVENAI